MKSLKSVLAILMAVCLMMCLAVPAFATEATETTTAATEAVVDATLSMAKDEEADHDHDHEETVTTGAQVERSGFASVARVILIVLEVITSIALIVVVLLQSGKEAGLSGALSGNSDSYLSKNGGGLDKMLAKSTKWVALAWIVFTLLLALI